MRIPGEELLDVLRALPRGLVQEAGTGEKIGAKSREAVVERVRKCLGMSEVVGSLC